MSGEATDGATDVLDSLRDEIVARAKGFLDDAFRSLTDARALPPPRDQPFLLVGQDFFGHEVHGSPFSTLDTLLSETFPSRFAKPLEGPRREFASAYIFSLLEAAIALCALRRETFDADSGGAEMAINSLLHRLATSETEIVCCRFVSHLATATGEPLEVGDVTIYPQSDEIDSRDYASVAALIPTVGRVFKPEPPFVHDRPHALVVARGIGADPFELVNSVTARIDRFLLLLHLIHAGTSQSYWEVSGEPVWVGKSRPLLREFVYTPTMGPMARRTVRLSTDDVSSYVCLGELLDNVEVQRAKMAATSWDVALRNFARSFVERGWPDQIIDLATALEALLAGTAKEDLTLRLRVRTAALLATADDPGPTVFNDVSTLYNMRSRLVHGSDIKIDEVTKFGQTMSTVEATGMHGIEMAQAVDRARDLVRRVVLARLCLATGEGAVWPLGMDAGVDAKLTDDPTRSAWRSLWHRKLQDIGAGTAADKAVAAVDWLSQEGRD